jgi:hypothetical protein
MTEYKRNTAGALIRSLDGATIPADPRNTDYAAYQVWLAKGNQPDQEVLSSGQVSLLVNTERDRRLALGIEYPPGSGRIIQTRTQDLENISNQMLRAATLVALGTPEDWGDTRTWLDASNGNPLPLPTPQEMIDLGLFVGDRKEALIYRSYAIKARIKAGESLDFTADAPWA